jgi:hypothetical protein
MDTMENQRWDQVPGKSKYPLLTAHNLSFKLVELNNLQSKSTCIQQANCWFKHFRNHTTNDVIIKIAE